MENASKALIIAAAILLSILIIALGMRVFTASSSAGDSVSLESNEIQAHNSKFLAYEGKIKGSQVVNLINDVQKNNSQYNDRKISLKIGTGSSFKPMTEGSLNNKLTLNKACLYYNSTITVGSEDPEPDVAQYNQIKNEIQSTTTFNVKIRYDVSGMVKLIEIYKAN